MTLKFNRVHAVVKGQKNNSDKNDTVRRYRADSNKHRRHQTENGRKISCAIKLEFNDWLSASRHSMRAAQAGGANFE